MPESIQSVLERDRRGDFPDWASFDDALCKAVAARIPNLHDLPAAPIPIQHYFATRFLEWQVGNGGFAQAAMNCPMLFEPAARGYESLKKPQLADFVRKAAKLAQKENMSLMRAILGGLESTFAYFRRSPFDAFDQKLEQVGFFKNDEARLDYVRAHHKVFGDFR